MAWNNGDQYAYLGEVDRLDWVNLMLFGGTDLSPVQHAPNWQIADNIAKFAGKGIPASKALVGIGAFGVKYDIPPGTDPTWGTIDNYLSYPTYKEILAMDAGAAQKEYLQTGNAWIFYTGLGTEYGTNVSSKAGEAKAAGAKGMFIWTLDYDSQEAGKSLTKAVYQAMNP